MSLLDGVQQSRDTEMLLPSSCMDTLGCIEEERNCTTAGLAFSQTKTRPPVSCCREPRTQGLAVFCTYSNTLRQQVRIRTSRCKSSNWGEPHSKRFLGQALASLLGGCGVVCHGPGRSPF